MGAARCDTGRRELTDAPTVVEEIERLALEMTTLHEDGARAEVEQSPGRLPHVRGVGDRPPGQRLGLAQVRREERGEGHEPLSQTRDPGGLEEGLPGGRHQHGIDDQVRQRSRGETIGHGVDHRGGEQHARLGCPDIEVVEHGVELCGHEAGPDRRDRVHAAGVLRGERRHHTRAVDAESGEGLEVGLDARPAARVRAGDGERDVDHRLAMLCSCPRAVQIW